MSLLFRDATIVQADGRVLSACLGVEGERITHIGVGEGQWDSVIDASSLILIPGLVNAHTHAAMNLLRGAGDDMPLHDWLFDRIFPLEETLTGDDIYRGAQAAIAEMLAGGVTSFTDMYYFCDRLLEAVEESGIKCNIGRGVTSGEALDEADKLFFLPHSDRVRFDIAPHAEYTTSPALLRRCAAVAKAHGARAHIHASETKEEHEECIGRHGVTPVGLLEQCGLLDVPITVAHGVWLTDDDMDILAKHDATVAHCVKSNLKLGSGIARVCDMRARGVRVALGTDSAASNNRLDMFDEIRTAALVAKGAALDATALPAKDALYMATRAGALSQGRDDCGDLQVGFKADIAVLKMHGRNSLLKPDALSDVVYAAGREHVVMTLVDGAVRYKRD